MMSEIIAIQAGNRTVNCYQAVPESGQGPGVIVLHAWWGLNSFFKEFCDRLAGQGFVALAPDLYDGAVAETEEQAKILARQVEFEAAKAAGLACLDHLQADPAVQPKKVGAVGFSMGAAWAILLSSLRPDLLSAVVIFYGSEVIDFNAAQCAYQGHFAVDDPWEPLDDTRKMESDMLAAGREVQFFQYPGAGHWFFETNRPADYHAGAASLAWERTLEFLQNQLKKP
jgi:carboxymethylenebutenolidase